MPTNLDVRKHNEKLKESYNKKISIGYPIWILITVIISMILIGSVIIYLLPKKSHNVGSKVY